MSKHILIADDDAAIVAALHVLLNEEGYMTSTAQSVAEVKFFIDQKPLDLILLDMNYQRDTTSGKEGLELLAYCREKRSELPVVAMTGWGSVELSVAAMRMGAGDFVEKPWDNERLLSIIRNQIKLAESEALQEKLHQENTLLRDSLQQSEVSFVAADPSMKEMLATISQVAASDISVVLYGENGTGKSKLAAEIHALSARKDQPFISVNMGAIPESLFESEMFGHVKGAFTDAKNDRVGRFELAQGGTLFLDEIANIPLSQQAKLLRVLESGEFEKVGSNRTQLADVRIICATNANLPQLCDTGEFRRDLMYRLSGFDFYLPALRDRAGDILPLAKQTLAKLATKYKKEALQLSRDAEAALLSYDWPGNVRELQHCIERAVILATTSAIGARDLRLVGATQNVPENQPEVGSDQRLLHLERAIGTLGTSDLTLDDIEKLLLESRLAHYNGQVIPVAHSFGLSRSALYRRLEKYQIETKG